MGTTTNSIQRVKKLFLQTIAAFAVWILMAEVGIMCAWSSPYLAQLTAENSPLPLTATEASWVASLLYLGRFIGAISCSALLNVLGSKKTTLVCAIPIALGWILIFFADSPMWLYAARVSLGIGFGGAYGSFALYLGEVAASKIRGSLVSFAVMGAPFGNFIASVTGSNLTLQVSSSYYLAACIVFIAILSILPDSPHHLVRLKKIEAAEQSIMFYRSGDSTQEEIKEITEFVQFTGSASFKERLAEFKLRHVRRATVLVMMLFAYMQLSGLNNVVIYMETILRRSGSKLLEPSTVVSYALACSVIVSILCVRLYDKWGRRASMVFSSVGCGVSLIVLGTHFHLAKSNVGWSGSQLLPLVAVFMYNATFSMGLNAVPSIVSSEVYSAKVKPVASCIVNLLAAAVAFFAAKAYQPLVDVFGEAYVFWGHGIFTLTAVPYALLFMPETKGKSLQQIQNHLLKE